MVADLDKSGRLKGYQEVGLLRTVETDEEASQLEIAELNEGEQVQVGDRVVRRAAFAHHHLRRAARLESDERCARFGLRRQFSEAAIIAQ